MVSLYISTDSMNHLLQLPTKSPLLISWQAEVQRVINCGLGFLCWIWIDCRLKSPWLQGHKIIEWERWWKGDMWGERDVGRVDFFTPRSATIPPSVTAGTWMEQYPTLVTFYSLLFLWSSQGGKRGATGRWLSNGTYQKINFTGTSYFLQSLLKCSRRHQTTVCELYILAK